MEVLWSSRADVICAVTGSGVCSETLLGCARLSTNDQDAAIRVDALNEAGC
jgi:hypothetical protein